MGAEREGLPEVDRHHLYECAVQSVEADLDFVERVYRRKVGRPPTVLREDFCGTAALACAFVRRGEERRSLGVDLDAATLAWAREHNVRALDPDERKRVRLIRGDVRRVQTPRACVTAALNFSYWTFKTRAELVGYFRAARTALRPGGLLVLDAFGGSEAMLESHERRRIAAETCFDGTRVPSFVYEWEQALFNPITHDFRCYIHFRVGRRRIARAFRYDWRFWTLPEIRESLVEAGFADVEVYVDGWDEERGETDGRFRRRVRFDNEGVWVAYVVAGRDA